MSIKRYFRIRHLTRLVKSLLIDKLVIKAHTAYQEKTLLLIKTEAIGDYILFRNFIEQIKKSERFAGYKIILLGNELWKELALAYDSLFVDEFIWVNRNAFTKDANYRKRILKQVNELQVEYAIQANYSREFLIGDSLVRASQAKFRIGSKGDRLNEWAMFKSIADAWFTELVTVNNEALFEFEKNKLFFETLIHAPILLSLPQIHLPANNSVPEIICFPGAGEAIKQWPIEQYAVLLQSVYQVYKLPIRICGSAKENDLGVFIQQALPAGAVINDCGNTSLTELCNLIVNARILISNDSSAFHIAAAVQTPVVCILMGRHYGRFSPYPSHATWVHSLYPKAFLAQLEKGEIKAEDTHYTGIVSIDQITVAEVLEKVCQILSNQ